MSDEFRTFANEDEPTALAVNIGKPIHTHQNEKKDKRFRKKKLIN